MYYKEFVSTIIKAKYRHVVIIASTSKTIALKLD